MFVNGIKNIENRDTFDDGRTTPAPTRGLITRYLLLFLFLAIMIGLLASVARGSLLDNWLVSALQATLFLVLGILNVVFLNGGPYRMNFTRIAKWQISMLAGGLILISLFIVSWFIHDIEWLMILASTASFLLPGAVDQAWYGYERLPGVQPITWKRDILETNESHPIYKKDFELQFEVYDLSTKDLVADHSERNSDRHEKKAGPFQLKEKVSRYSKLGPVFIELESEKNPNKPFFHLAGNSQQSYSWAFYVRDLVLGKRWLDPYVSLHQNGISANSIIIAMRIKETES